MSPRLSLPRALGPFYNGGLEILAYKWSVDRKVDLSPIKTSYSQKWASLEGATLLISPLEEETTEAHRQRASSFREILTDLRRAGIPWREIRRMVREDLKLPGIQIRPLHDHEQISRSPSSRNFYATVVMSTLLHLYENEEVELAHSIWQSLRADGVSDGKQLPDQVGEWIKTDSRVQEDPWSLLQLDPNRDGSFNQVWLFDRIMTDGFIWVGQYQYEEVQSSESHRENAQKQDQWPGSSNDSASTQGQGPGDPFSQQKAFLSNALGNFVETRIAVVDTNNKLVEFNTGQGTSAPHPELREDQDLTEKETEGLLSFSHHSPTPKSILGQQLCKMLMHIGLINEFKMRGDSHRLEVSPASALANIIAYCMIEGSNIQSQEVERHRALQVACFDVDEPCLVFTPYHAAREMLPHPATRSMKACWVAKPFSADRGAAAEGMKLDGDSVSLAHDEPFSEGSECSKLKDQGEDDVLEEYEVQKMVKGVWRIMEYPKNKYIFR